MALISKSGQWGVVMTRIFTSLIISLFLFGCAANSVQTKAPTGTASLKEGASVYVSLPEDGVYDTTVYAKSGEMTASAFERALSPHVKAVVVGSQFETENQAMLSAVNNDADYLFIPEIVHWEDRATEWSGRKDRLTISITVKDVVSGEVLDKALIKGNSSWLTLGGDHPQDMLDEPINNYISTLVASDPK